MDKTYYVIPTTKVYDVERGIIEAKDLVYATYGMTYDLWGGKHRFIVEEAGKMRIKASNYGVYFGEDTEVPQFGHMPARKWKLLNGNEDDRRNRLAECLELRDGKPVLVTESPEEMSEFLEYVAFYGVTVDVSTVDGTIELDKRRPPCFFNKCMGQQENQIGEIVRDFLDGAWFRTLTPANEEYVERVIKEGVFYEGYKGFPDLMPVVITKGKGKDFPVIKITCPIEAGIDFGRIYV